MNVALNTKKPRRLLAQTRGVVPTPTEEENITMVAQTTDTVEAVKHHRWCDPSQCDTREGIHWSALREFEHGDVRADLALTQSAMTGVTPYLGQFTGDGEVTDVETIERLGSWLIACAAEFRAAVEGADR